MITTETELDNYLARLEAEELILDLAGSIRELRWLREENERLKARNEELNNQLNLSWRSSQECVGEIFKAIIKTHPDTALKGEDYDGV